MDKKLEMAYLTGSGVAGDGPARLKENELLYSYSSEATQSRVRALSEFRKKLWPRKSGSGFAIRSCGFEREIRNRNRAPQPQLKG